MTQYQVVEIVNPRRGFRTGSQAVVVLQELTEWRATVDVPQGYTRLVLVKLGDRWFFKNKVGICDGFQPSYVPTEVLQAARDLAKAGYCDQGLIGTVPKAMRIVCRDNDPDVVLILRHVDRRSRQVSVLVPQLDGAFLVGKNDDDHKMAVISRFRLSTKEPEEIPLSYHVYWGIVRLAEDAVEQRELPLLLSSSWLIGRLPAKTMVYY